ncbi:RdgB/HAM1 family non-canonical purine NTP pyrophosphatase [Aquirufa regiilacus]|uniref:dITP/XTP pyrophosphatase n=1 Tax=Aquirufa regiilacus TaxID=3024868 RepID=A0ABU3TT52_9BACT|nr:MULTISPECIES: RdgB/HAM1 family non-canonical purine NTP pyrophosphatase [unclassified Aquirufa]MDT8887739.1 RdgB/HAM1 family non-canonical purine NTP pyrophosphatase [Aquirufa sp. LEPPI-3A]MDU0809050.1 RdgB/HAM1 family non-canonical purine NTP pyrophosphatase [Aquirufa sp. LEOWEIH-7C]
MKPTIYLATQNKHKIEEIKDLLGDLFDIHTVFELGLSIEIPETGHTLQENARQKAEYIAEHFQVTCLSDDSGLEVNALGGRPGVYSARYAGEPKDDAANVDKLLFELSDSADRSARFVTVLTLHHQGQYISFEGEVLGDIVREPRGTQGFGYDPVFQPLGNDRTFAEMSMAEKNALAHRARAMQKFKSFLAESEFFSFQ